MSLLGRVWIWAVAGLLGAAFAAASAQAHECGCGYGRHAAAYARRAHGAGGYETATRVRREVSYRYVREPAVRYGHAHAIRYARTSTEDYARGPAAEEQHYGYLDEAADQGFAYRASPGLRGPHVGLYDHQRYGEAPPPVEGYARRGYGEQGYAEQGYGEQAYGERSYGDVAPPVEGYGRQYYGERGYGEVGPAVAYDDYGQRGAAVRSWSSERDSSRYYSETNGYERGGEIDRRTVCDEFCRTHTYVRGDIWPRPPEDETDIGLASVPDTFFLATGGVGPEFIGGGGGGGGVSIINGGGFGFGGASANASASASASASARIMSSIMIGGRFHFGGGWGGHGMSHGCGCGGGHR